MNPVESQGGKRKRSLSDDAPPPQPSNAAAAPSKFLVSMLLSFLTQYASFARLSSPLFRFPALYTPCNHM